MKIGNFTFRILIKGKSIQEYFHESRTFVEGRDGSEFELEFRNDSNNTVMMIPSVDGLCALDGEPAGPNSKGYIVKPWRTLTIPGWILDNANAAKFKFESKQTGQYVNQVTGSSANAGVIGCMVFAEQQPTVKAAPQPYPVLYPVPYPVPPYIPVVPIAPQPWIYHNNFRVMGIVDGGDSRINCSNNMVGSGICSASGSMAGGVLFSNAAGDMSYGTLDGVMAASSSTSSVEMGLPPKSQERNGPSLPGTGNFEALNTVDISKETIEQLGTAFGAKTSFNTISETFNRGKELARMVIFYKTRRDLERMGIKIIDTSFQRAASEPNPFPGETGCKPPRGWKG